MLKLKTDVGLSEYRLSPNPVAHHNCLHQNGQLEGIPPCSDGAIGPCVSVIDPPQLPKFHPTQDGAPQL